MEKMTVLYIEDNSQQRTEFTKDLRDRGFKVHPAASGKTGLDKLRDYEIDVILCDLNMPGMTGIDVLKKVKQTGQNIPFVMLTAHGTVAQAVRSIKMGAYDFILKPADFSEIENAIHNAIERKLLEEKVEERTKSYQDANRKLRQKARELEKATLSLGNANVKLFEIQEELAEKNNEMKKLLEELSNKRNELQAIIDASFNCVVMVNEGGKIVSANRQINEYFGIEGDSFLNRSFEYFLRRIRSHVKDKKRFDEIAKDVKNTPDSFNALIIDPHQLFEHEIKLVKPKPRIVSLLCGHVLDRNDKRMGRVWMIVDITKSKLADEQLHAIVDASPIPFIISRFDDGKILYANKPLANLLGLSPSEMVGRNTPDFYENPEDRKVVLEKVKRDGYLYHHEVEIRKADGVKVWMILSLIATELSGERVVVGALYDINERRKAEDELKKERNFVSAVLDTAGALVVVLDVEGRIIRFNRACEHLTGYSFKEVANREFWKIFLLPEEVDMVMDRFRKLKDGQFPANGENYWLTKAGEKKLIAWSNSYLKNEGGEIDYIIATGIDITERKEAEDKLRLYRRIFMNSNDGITIFDPDGKFVERNQAHRNATGFSDKEIEGKKIADFVGEESSQRIIAGLEQKGNFRGEIGIKVKSGKEKHIDLSVFPILDDSKEVACYVGMGRDISERIKAEEALREANVNLKEEIEERVEAEKKIANRLRYEKGLAAASESLLADYNTADALQESLKHLLVAVDACRVYIFQNFEDPDDGLCMRQTHEACAPEVEPQIDNPALQHVPYKAGFERWKKLLSKGKPVLGHVNTFPESERAILEEQDIKSILVLPIWTDNEWYGFIGFDHTRHERGWGDEDILLLKTAEKVIGGYIVRRKAELALQESEERFRNLVENANDIIYSLTPEGVFTYVSPNWTNILGHDISEVLGKPFVPFVHPDDVEECFAFLNKTVESGKRQSGVEYRVKHKDGTWKWHTTSASPFKDKDENILYFIGVAHDITERKKTLDDLEEAYRNLRQTQAQLVQSEKMASLGMLVAGIAHEINTPVGAINSMHNTLVRAVDKLRELVNQEHFDATQNKAKLTKAFQLIEDANKVILSGTNRVMNIVRRLRSFARLDEAEIKKGNIHDGIEDTLTLVHHELKHSIKVVKNYGEIPEISCFPSKLNQVFLNILINAKQAIKKERGRIKISTYQEDKKIFVEIEDNGVGIPTDKLKRIFDPGFTTKGVGVGTGLGLSICYQIIQDHHGEITVESEVGKGSKFTIILPTNLDEILEVS